MNVCWKVWLGSRAAISLKSVDNVVAVQEMTHQIWKTPGHSLITVSCVEEKIFVDWVRIFQDLELGIIACDCSACGEVSICGVTKQRRCVGLLYGCAYFEKKKNKPSCRRGSPCLLCWLWTPWQIASQFVAYLIFFSSYCYLCIWAKFINFVFYVVCRKVEKCICFNVFKFFMAV